jgi:hypothetical protein
VKGTKTLKPEALTGKGGAGGQAGGEEEGVKRRGVKLQGMFVKTCQKIAEVGAVAQETVGGVLGGAGGLGGLAVGG